jgi:amidophosphoribosyltransferase
MCGITGIISSDNNIISDFYESLLNIQHRGQDACGYVINNIIYKKNDLVKNAISNESLSKLKSNIAIGHTRYPTTYSKNENENQPFQVKLPNDNKISLVHNGNIYDYDIYLKELEKNNINFNSKSDSEFLLYYIYYLIIHKYNYLNFDNAIIFSIKYIIDNIKGAYSVILLIENYGLVCFRDKFGIRPLMYGKKNNTYMISSENIAHNILEYNFQKDIENIAIFKNNGNVEEYNYNFKLKPCLFEYIYLARPESKINKVSVYDFRINMGNYLAKNIINTLDVKELNDIDAVIPIPDTSIISTTSLAEKLNKPLKFGIIKNRYIDRTFIMNNNITRNKNIKRKFLFINSELNNKNIILVDDSIVRGNTCKHIINELKLAGVKKIYFASCAPPIKYINKYGIDLPLQTDLIAYNKNNKEISKILNIDTIIYQTIDDLKKSFTDINNNVLDFELSVFDNVYIN